MKLQSWKGLTARCMIWVTFLIAALCRSLTVYAQTHYVSSGCKLGIHDYTSMHRPIVGTPPGAILYICHGAYSEQVTIQQPLNFQGIQLGDGDSVILAYPERTSNTVSRYVDEFAAHAALLWRLTFTLFTAISG